MTDLKKTYTVSKGSDFWRYYIVAGKEIGSIKIYNTSGVIYETIQGWFELKSYEDVVSIELEKDVKRAKKINFNRKDNFIIKSERDSYFIKYDLYLHESEFESIKHFQKIVIDNADYIQRANYAELTFKHGFTYEKYNYNKETKKGYYTEEKARTLTQLNGYYLPRELKPHGQKKKKIQEKLQKILHIEYINADYVDDFMKQFKELETEAK